MNATPTVPISEGSNWPETLAGSHSAKNGVTVFDRKRNTCGETVVEGAAMGFAQKVAKIEASAL